jgi:thiamine-monophosphate kinase
VRLRSYNRLVRVSEIGEFGLIKLLAQEIGAAFEDGGAPRPGVLVDIGDDAVVAPPVSGAQVWTTDTLVAGVHFLPQRTPWRNAGWKAMAVNVSDIAAMGARPYLALVTLNLPADSCVEDIIDLYRGLRDCCDAYGVIIGGGDIVRAPIFSVTVALSGEAAVDPQGQPRVLRRSTAVPGDLVAVTGTLGDAAAGLRLVRSGASREDPAAARLIEAHERPRPSVEEGLAAVSAGVTCGMDISDGLVQDLGHICRTSGAAAEVDAARLPLSDELRSRFPADAVDLALSGGEDYELLYCASGDALDRLQREGVTVTVIGSIRAGSAAVTVRGLDGVERVWDAAGGWDHFRGGTSS